MSKNVSQNVSMNPPKPDVDKYLQDLGSSRSKYSYHIALKRADDFISNGSNLDSPPNKLSCCFDAVKVDRMVNPARPRPWRTVFQRLSFVGPNFEMLIIS